jgi:hypothetical protein
MLLYRVVQLPWGTHDSTFDLLVKLAVKLAKTMLHA